MAAIVEISKTKQTDGPLVDFGPNDEKRRYQLSIPRTFTRLAKYVEMDLTAELTCSFDGNKIVLHKLALQRDETSVATRDLMKLSLPWVIQQVAKDAIPNSYRWFVGVADLNEKIEVPREETLLYLAQLYWFEYVTWGAPRERIMAVWGISRTTANTWIKQASKLYGLPGAHAAEVDSGQ